MRIRIRRVEDDLRASMVEAPDGKNIAVDGLPTGMRELCLRMLTGLPGIKSVLIYDHPEQTLLDRGSGHATLRVIPDEALRARVTEVADLLQWHFSVHWAPKSHEDDEFFCIYCRVGSTDNPDSFCPNPHCDCHEKWQAIVGPGYQKPVGNGQFFLVAKTR